MKLKDQLMLREVAGQYVIIPTGERVREVTSIVYISSSAAYLWDYMKDHEFTREDLVQCVMEHYTGVTEEQAGADIDQFLKTLADNNILTTGLPAAIPLPGCRKSCWTSSGRRRKGRMSHERI